ncbi:hypothetical protein CLOP_g21568 [Closterium sp. NIES-67]|nr:hypothetical protein CLOP_g21568 [Closterium sp. NIES-67]
MQGRVGPDPACLHSRGRRLATRQGRPKPHQTGLSRPGSGRPWPRPCPCPAGIVGEWRRQLMQMPLLVRCCAHRSWRSVWRDSDPRKGSSPVTSAKVMSRLGWSG